MIWDSEEFEPSFQALKHHIRRMHKAGVLHGDIHAKNIIVRDDNSVVLIDFERSQMSASRSAMKEESVDIRDMVRPGLPSCLQSVLARRFATVNCPAVVRYLLSHPEGSLWSAGGRMRAFLQVKFVRDDFERRNFAAQAQDEEFQ